MIRTILLLLALVAIILPVGTQAKGNEVWYKCIARAASHTGRYTFRINTKACRVYWLEIDTQMKILACDQGRIKALKPSAISDADIVYFNMNTGRFYDNLSGVHDRGVCERIDTLE